MNLTKTTTLTFLAFLAGIASIPAAADPAQEPPAATPVEAPAPSILIPHPDIGNGDCRSETLAAAVRLHGLSRSFDADAFISHILYVTGIADKDAFPKKSWSTGLSRRLSKAGLVKVKATPKPGDLVIFSLSHGAPHSAKASKITIGVVENVRRGSIEFILAGSNQVIRGKLKTGKARVKETVLTSCKAPVEKSKVVKKKSRKKKGRSAGASKAVPCRASELLVGFANIDDVALELNPLIPSPPPRPDVPVTSGQESRPVGAGTAAPENSADAPR